MIAHAVFVLLSSLAAYILVAIGPPTALAERKDLGNAVIDDLTRRFCGDCHMAYAPINLPARSWSTLIDHLDDHFGVRLVINETARRHIRAYLISKSADGGGTHWGRRLMKHIPADTAPLRITATPRFTRHHNGARFRALLAEKKTTPSRCTHCHGEAELCVLGEPPR
ncbi:cytochrome C [Varunaivibrio sulfuroxidans]|uniref:Diheme cytochrome c n=1 Tax=Varunaivibrio sulfuroxidans TaxID=1773489 RepID=A0A4R3JIB9_9PROT|nr:cytochrome C [Varunaivibrio sulfuroxidans]TCS65016.1 diheme cytochrome c [Varunaivibrio sulfuroxidans]WES29694.1 hypothetical protein P3M64_08520 [Varunaivibrio sulfuroxidans]